MSSAEPFLRWNLTRDEYDTLTPAQRETWGKWWLRESIERSSTSKFDIERERDTGWTEPTKG